jgi:hypothetical protein
MHAKRRQFRNGNSNLLFLTLGFCIVLAPHRAEAQAPIQARSVASDPPKCTVQTGNGAMVLTQHNDRERTGAFLDEACLTASNVDTSGNFGLLYFWKVDGQIYAQPLYVSGVKLPDGSVRNIVYIATMKNHIYAFDADGGANQAALWDTVLGPPADYDLFPLEFWFTGQ